MTDDDARPWAAPGHERRDARPPAPPTRPAEPYGPPGYPAAPPPGLPDDGSPDPYRPASGEAGARDVAAGSPYGAGPPSPYAPAAASAQPFAVSERHRRQVFGGPGYDSPAYRNDRVAVSALVLGIVGIAVPGICLLAVALGHLGMHRVRNSYHGGRGLAVAGLVLGYVMTAVWLAVFVLQLVLNSL